MANNRTPQKRREVKGENYGQILDAPVEVQPLPDKRPSYKHTSVPVLRGCVLFWYSRGVQDRKVCPGTFIVRMGVCSPNMPLKNVASSLDSQGGGQLSYIFTYLASQFNTDPVYHTRGVKEYSAWFCVKMFFFHNNNDLMSDIISS